MMYVSAWMSEECCILKNTHKKNSTWVQVEDKNNTQKEK